MKNDFGIDRVLEPSNAVPVTSWKMDNRREISTAEVRIRLGYIHIEHDSFRQICNDCNYEETKVIAKIMDIIERRGKLHNPFSDSGGVCCGTIEEIGSTYRKSHNYNVGDEVFCATTLTAIPIHIDEIEKIDYNYCQLKVKGYAILFEASPIFLRPRGFEINYTMTALDETGSLFSICKMVTPGMRILVIGKDIVTALIYCAGIKKAVNNDCYIIVAMDPSCCNSLTDNEVRKAFKDYGDKTFIVDVTKPIYAFDEIMKGENNQLMDLTVNCEYLIGTETLSVFMTKQQGQLYFTSIKNNYNSAVLVAESVGKEITSYAFDQYSDGYNECTMEILDLLGDRLKQINKLYTRRAKAVRGIGKIAEDLDLRKAGKIDGFVFLSPVTKALAEEVINIAAYDCNVIIQGETGVGKEKILGLIHQNSARKGNPCIKINCATVHENLAESEFFGYEAGAFTGAQSGGKKGYFELANNGILFLDEVGSLSMNMQSKLLRVLQENTFYRVGGTKQISVNVRVICADNVPIRKLVEEGRFREDLWYRMNIYTIDVPALRERKEDIYALTTLFLQNYNKRYGVNKEITSEAIGHLMKYDFPGNVRELENIVHRLVINTRENVINEAATDSILNESVYEDIVTDLKHALKKEEGLDFNQIIDAQEKKLIQYALRKETTTRKAAELLSMTQAQLMRKKKKFDL